MPGLVPRDAGLTDVGQDSFVELSNSSNQCFNILCSGDKDGVLCFSIFGVFPIGNIVKKYWAVDEATYVREIQGDFEEGSSLAAENDHQRGVWVLQACEGRSDNKGKKDQVLGARKIRNVHRSRKELERELSLELKSLTWKRN
ncbi:uncharacterized protein LOC130139275 [Syzygium oleosum]|uniref:uncharacterized protein LOC130139275 n=1 Tax=Syzygium oleosum TaxID=219896 RepID=UPI0024B9B1B0|nr:uncharacterized protein LOC130139275 [Syzygium oleosum]